MVIEVFAIGTIAWALGFILATASVEIVLRAVGFLRFTDAGDVDVNPILSGGSSLVVCLLTFVVEYWRGRVTTR